MLCSLCRTFIGTPCAVCRTYSRIGWQLHTIGLAPCQETAALQILRDCCGAITDLAEANRAAVASLEKQAVGKAVEPGQCKEEKHSEPSSGRSGVLEKTEAEKAVKSGKKDKPEKDKKKRKDKGIEEPSSGEEESPGKEVKGKRKKAEDLQSDKKKKVKVEEKEDTEEAPRRVTAAEELQDRVDEFVSSNPRSFELGTLPVRGSVARTLEEGRRRREGGERRPAEPDHPPPRRHEDHRRGDTEPRAQGERKKKKSKGATHRARGRRWRENRRQY